MHKWISVSQGTRTTIRQCLTTEIRHLSLIGLEDRGNVMELEVQAVTEREDNDKTSFPGNAEESRPTCKFWELSTCYSTWLSKIQVIDWLAEALIWEILQIPQVKILSKNQGRGWLQGGRMPFNRSSWKCITNVFIHFYHFYSHLSSSLEMWLWYLQTPWWQESTRILGALVSSCFLAMYYHTLY